MASESEQGGGSRVAGYAICAVLALPAALFVRVSSTWTTLLLGAALMGVLALALAALRSRMP